MDRRLEDIDLPICDVLDDIVCSLEQSNNLIILAPPGAGKTTLVPLSLLDSKWRERRKILVLEPRRLAASAAARRMADLLDEPVGQRVGYRIRFETRVSDNTVIEVVTEGILRRMLATDPDLSSVAAVIFDEIHERHIDSDISLALCLDLQAGLRDDLRLIAMSATLDSATLSDTLQAPVVESKGRSFPVEIEYEARLPDMKLESEVVRVVKREIRKPDSGSILVFLPGQKEIERTFSALEAELPDYVAVHKLYGTMNWQDQQLAISAPKTGWRKIVLSTDIAETSLTIEGIKTVIDSGMSRQPVFEVAIGLTRLKTVRASQSSAVQRSGRAGRLQEGRAVRLWHEGQTRSMPEYDTPEILNADLSSLVLDLADWGVTDPDKLRWLSPPPDIAFNKARSLLARLGALNDADLLTAHGRAMRELGLPPRLSHMILRAYELNAPPQRPALLALLLQERNAGGRRIDLQRRFDAMSIERSPMAKKMEGAVRSIVAGLKEYDSRQLSSEFSIGALLAFAFPDRVAQQTGHHQGDKVRYRLANGSGAELDVSEPLSQEPYLVVADMIGRAGAAQIVSAAAISNSEIEQHFADSIETKSELKFDEQSQTLTKHSWSVLGALRLSKPVSQPISEEDSLNYIYQRIRNAGLGCLPWSEKDKNLLNRLRCMNDIAPGQYPDFSENALLDELEDWLGPFLSNIRSLKQLGNGKLKDALLFRAGSDTIRQLKIMLPSHFSTPAGSSLVIDYDGEHARLSIRPQELYGLDKHPTIAGGRVPLELELVSPAGRPIQITRDLPGFWKGSWKDVRKEMRGRYPKHLWPDDPVATQPTNRAKARK